MDRSSSMNHFVRKACQPVPEDDGPSVQPDLLRLDHIPEPTHHVYPAYSNQGYQLG